MAQLYDTIIIGGGIVGAATADSLTQRQQKLLLLDQFAPGHEHGSSHGDGRIIRYDYPEAFYVQMSRLSYPAWDKLSERAGQRLWQQTGMWSCGPIGHPELQALKANFQQHGIPYESLSAAESNQRFPQFQLDEASEAYYQPHGGVIFATPAVKALWRLAAEGGATTMPHQQVVEIAMRRDSVRVRTASGDSWEGGRLVIAAGGWAEQILALLNLHLPLTVTQEQLAYFSVKGNLSHKVGEMPVFVDYHTDPCFYGLPQVEIAGVKIGWHHTGQQLAGPNARLPFDEANLRGVQALVRRRFPHLQADAPVARVTCLYTNTPDYHFVLDRHPEWSHVVIGTGFSGHGFKFAPLLGDILAALTLDETPPVPLDNFTINRFNDLETLKRRTAA